MTKPTMRSHPHIKMGYRKGDVIDRSLRSLRVKGLELSCGRDAALGDSVSGTTTHQTCCEPRIDK